ncbi:MAG: caspase family protein [Rhodospirillaceae bacterium]|nr:caspase family protein [Rhodospirillaceae bacterium]
MHWLVPALSCFLLLAAAPTSASAEPRLALVVANGAYVGGLDPLTNPANDGKLIAATLQKLGFEVTLVQDVDQKGMKRAISEFGDALMDAGPTASALFYYAGHGLQVEGQNYLVPINAAIAKEADVDLEAVSADAVLKQMEYAAPRTSIVILDACRNNPLSRGFRSATRGLARMDAPNGSYVAYSTAPGQTAADGTGKNSPFAAALAAEIVKPGQGIEEAFRNVRVTVSKATDGAQTPWDSSSLMSSFYFAGVSQVAAIAPVPVPEPQPIVVTAPAVAEPSAAEMSFWDSIKNSTSSRDYAAYLKKFPEGTFADLAKGRQEEFEAKDASRTTVPSAIGDNAPQTASVVPEPDPEFESPLPDGTIVLSPKIKAALDAYLEKYSSNSPDFLAYFYVSANGRGSGFSGCNWSAGTAATFEKCKSSSGSGKAKTRARADCESTGNGDCTLLFIKGDGQRDYKVFGQ